MAISVGKGRASVTISGALADGLEREVRALLGPLSGALQAEADGILAKIETDWPVRTGKSRASWETRLRLTPGAAGAEVILHSDVFYTRFIKTTKKGEWSDRVRLNSPLQTLVRKPARESKKTLKKSLPKLLGKHLQGGIDG